MDGNVKRILTRYYAIEGFPSDNKINQQLWELAIENTPMNNYAQYNQAIMDLGATVCLKHNPSCGYCPLSSHCKAFSLHRMSEFPWTKKPKPKPKKIITMLVIINSSKQIFLYKRGLTGIWGGLWCFPECDIEESPENWCHKNLGTLPVSIDKLPSFKHIFTHFELTIDPVLVKITEQRVIRDAGDYVWYEPESKLPGGISAPVAKLLKQIRRNHYGSHDSLPKVK